MININNIKTIPQSIDYLNRVILGMSETNQVIPKAYTSAFPVQERLDELEEKSNDTLVDISVLNGIVEELLVATEDTGWQPLEITNASANPSTSAMFIRKIGNVVSITGSINFSSAYAQAIPGGYLVELPLEYRPANLVQGICFTTFQGNGGEALFVIATDGNLRLTAGQQAGTNVSIRGIVYLAQ